MKLLDRALSHDPPRSRALALLLVLIVAGLAAAPFLFPGSKALDTAAKMLVFILLVASYDLLLGYTGIVSFAHTMFFGIGAYGVAIASGALGAGPGALLVGIAGALALSLALSLVIGLFSLRVKAIFFAMITLAVASAFQNLASQLSEFTGGEDGLSFSTFFSNRIGSYYLLFGAVLVLFLMLLRIVNSPFGRVLQAIRENDFRAEAIGFRSVVYRTLSNILGAGFATLAGALLAIWLRYTGPDTTLGFEVMLDILLIAVIGGMGTMYGAVVGAVVFVFAQYYLQDGLRAASHALAGIPFASALLTPDRWLLWLGLLFVLSVYYFPTGLVGRLRALALRER